MSSGLIVLSRTVNNDVLVLTREFRRISIDETGRVGRLPSLGQSVARPLVPIMLHTPVKSTGGKANPNILQLIPYLEALHRLHEQVSSAT